MEGIGWAFADAPPVEAYQSVCGNEDEAKAAYEFAKAQSQFMKEVHKS